MTIKKFFKNFISISFLLVFVVFTTVSCGVLSFFNPSTSSSSSEEKVERTPPVPIMGWASWNAYRTNISEDIILSQAEQLQKLGLQDLGYLYVNVDDGWQKGRGSDGYVNVHPTRFPSGMKNLADTLHEMGFYAGIYTDAGALTCAYNTDSQSENDDVGLLNHDESDLRRYFIDWDYDFIKVDWCGGKSLKLSQEERYTEIGRIINEIEEEIGEDKIYNVCSWAFPGEWVVDVADSWRTGGDLFNTFDAVVKQIDNIKTLAKYHGPGHVNDLDMLQVGNGMTYEEDKSHFSMWCMMSTPLMLGMDLNGISSETLSIISNKELIAIDQDPACIQATLAKTYGKVEAWTKDLGSANSGKKAIALLNRSNAPQSVTVSFSELGLKNIQKVRDLWAHTDIPVNDTYHAVIPAHGTVVLSAEGEAFAMSTTQNSLGIPQVELNGNNLNVSVDAFSLINTSNVEIVLVDKNGNTVDSYTKAIERNKMQTVTTTFNVETPFVGKVIAYLNSNGTELCNSTEKEITHSLNGDYDVGPMKAKSLVAKGAVLLDVRTAEEYAKEHLKNAINLDYSKILTDAEKVIPNKNTPIVVYCSAAKRSTQALWTLLDLGYTNVYNLGSMANYDAKPILTFSGKTCKVVTTGDTVEVEYTANPNDKPEVYVSVGENSTFYDAVPINEFKVPEKYCYYLTLKAYLAYEGVCYAETSERFIYWSSLTVDTYASELEWSKATIGSGTIHKDKSVEGNTLTLAGKTFNRGIGTHATSDIVMNIPEGATKFLAVAGCDREVKVTSGTYAMVFYVYIDGVLVDSSSLLTVNQYYVFDIDIPEGAQEIRLYAFEGEYIYNSADYDHADWAIAAFFADII